MKTNEMKNKNLVPVAENVKLPRAQRHERASASSASSASAREFHRRNAAHRARVRLRPRQGPSGSTGGRSRSTTR